MLLICPLISKKQILSLTQKSSFKKSRKKLLLTLFEPRYGMGYRNCRKCLNIWTCLFLMLFEIFHQVIVSRTLIMCFSSALTVKNTRKLIGRGYEMSYRYSLMVKIAGNPE